MRAKKALSGCALKLTGVCSPLVLFLLVAQAAYGQPAQAPTAAGTSDALNNLVQTYCVECHNLEDYSGGLDFEGLDLGHVGGDAEVWEAAIGKLLPKSRTRKAR